MSKILIVIILIIVVVAIFTVAKQFQGVKFENIGSLFRVNYNVPSGLTGEKPSISYPTGGSTPAPASQPAAQPSAKPAPTPPSGFTVAQLSPYYEEVRIGSVSAGSWNGVSQFSLNASFGGATTTIDVTGWRLVSNTGQVLIPQAAADYNPTGFETPGDIMLGSGQVLNVYSSQSPVGVNFRMNSCVGYLNSTYSFTPALPQSCAPVYDRSEIVTFSGACQSAILSVGGCSSPSSNEINRFAGDSACQAILNRFNYASCYNRNRFQTGFFSNEWRVWLGSPIHLDSSHDRLLLLDKQGLLVNEYIY